MIHDFMFNLAYSNAQGDLSFWKAFYQEAFPSMVEMVDCSGDMACQRVGIDRKIKLAIGQTVKIDEKKRRRDFGDILLEYISVDTTNAPGWIEKQMGIDYIAYAFMESRRVYLFPFALLQRAWRKNGHEWKMKAARKQMGFRIVVAQNRTYKTLSIAVPTPVLLNAIADAGCFGKEGR